MTDDVAKAWAKHVAEQVAGTCDVNEEDVQIVADPSLPAGQIKVVVHYHDRLTCFECRHRDVHGWDPPCDQCCGYSLWEAP